MYKDNKSHAYLYPFLPFSHNRYIFMNLEIIKEEPLTAVHVAPIIFIHGMWHAAWCWEEYFLPYFTQHGYACYALSLRGHGNSEGHENLRWSSLDDYVSDLSQVSSQFETPPILIGHSMGGMVVQKYLVSHEVTASVLLASVPPTGVMMSIIRTLFRHPLSVIKSGLTLSMKPIVNTPNLAKEAFFSRNMDDEKIMGYFSKLQDESFRAFLDILVFNQPRLKKLESPLLVLGAENDRIITPKEVAKTAEAYGVEAEIFSDMSHDMMLDSRWQDVADRILNWLEFI
jgi:pimeloyl-ACP methyl ester carboxylesterase